MTESTKPDHFPDITKVISKDGKLSHLTEEEKRDYWPTVAPSPEEKGNE